MLQTLESRSNGVGDWDPIYYRCLWIALTTADSWIGCFGPFFYQVLGGFSSEICISSDPCSIGKFAPIAVQPTVPLEFLQPSTLVQTDGYDELKSKRNPTSVSKKSSLSYQQCQVWRHRLQIKMTKQIQTCMADWQLWPNLVKLSWDGQPRPLKTSEVWQKHLQLMNYLNISINVTNCSWWFKSKFKHDQLSKAGSQLQKVREGIKRLSGWNFTFNL